jgi:hypothetical protein
LQPRWCITWWTANTIRDLAIGLGRKVIDLRFNIREPVDLCGIPVPDLETRTTRWLVPDELPRSDDVLISSRKR